MRAAHEGVRRGSGDPPHIFGAHLDVSSRYRAPFRGPPPLSYKMLDTNKKSP